jgi:hypothetical protein
MDPHPTQSPLSQTHPQPLPRVPRAEGILPTIRRHIDERRKLVDTIIQTVDTGNSRFENVVGPIAELQNRHAGTDSMITALQYCSPDAATREAVGKSQ